MKRLILLVACGAGLAAWAGPAAAPPPAGLPLPLTLYDVTFNQNEPGTMPRAATKEEVEALLADPWHRVVRSYSRLDYVTRGRTALVEAEAFGLKDRPLVFTVTDNAQPTWGPRLSFSLPGAVAEAAKAWRVSVDVALAAPARMGCINLEGVAELHFCEDGLLRCGKVEVCRYRGGVPLHLEITVANDRRSVRIVADGGKPLELPWSNPDTRALRSLRLDGITPGGYNHQGRIAFDNLRVQLLELR